MDPTIRQAREEEADALIAMYEWLFVAPGHLPPQWDPDRARAALAEAMQSADSTVLVAETPEGLAGFVTAYLELNSVRYGRRVWVEDLAVDPTARSRGIGNALLDAAKTWALGRGATHLELDTGLARTDAQRFYDRQGASAKGYSYSWWLT